MESSWLIKWISIIYRNFFNLLSYLEYSTSCADRFGAHSSVRDQLYLPPHSFNLIAKEVEAFFFPKTLSWNPGQFYWALKPACASKIQLLDNRLQTGTCRLSCGSESTNSRHSQIIKGELGELSHWPLYNIFTAVLTTFLRTKRTTCDIEPSRCMYNIR
jgi:hypothetical protein